MKVKEIIEKSAELLGVELTDENTENLLRCYNLVENELAIDYFPLRAVEKVMIEEDEIRYEDLKNNPLRICEIIDFKKDDVEYKLYPEYIKLKKNRDVHLFNVRYNYIPKKKTIEDKSSYSIFYTDILKYGVCAEYALSLGNFGEAKVWSGKYKNAIEIEYIIRGQSV